MKLLRNGYAICAFVMLLAGLVMAYHWVDWYHTGVLLALLNLFPAIIIGGNAYYMMVPNATKKSWSDAGLVVLLIGGCIGMNYFAGDFHRHLAHITDPRQYGETLRNHWAGDPAIAHFPKTIPTYARNLRFNSLPGFGQGGTETTLIFTTTADRIAALYRDYTKKASVKSYDHEILGGFVQYSYTPPSVFPRDFTFFLLNNPNTVQNSMGYGGLAISKQRNEVCYWAKVVKP